MSLELDPLGPQPDLEQRAAKLAIENGHLRMLLSQACSQRDYAVRNLVTVSAVFIVTAVFCLVLIAYLILR